MNLQLHCELGIVVMQNSVLIERAKKWLYIRLPPSLRLPQAINFLNQSPKQRAIIFYFHLFAECVCLCLHIHLLMRQCGQVCMCTVTFAEETNWSTGQMPPSKGWLFLASALLTHIQYTACLNRTETKCVPAYGRSGYKAVQIFFFRRGYRAKSKTEFQHSGMWRFCLQGLISSFLQWGCTWQSSWGSHVEAASEFSLFCVKKS